MAKVASGLRRGKPKALGGVQGAGGDCVAAAGGGGGGVQYAPLKPASQKYSANSQDRFCELLLPWRMLHEFSESQQSQRRSGSDGSDSVPLCFESYDDYILAWEPLLMEEIKGGILSSLPHSSKPKSARTGVVNVCDATDDTMLSTVTLGWHQINNVDARESHGGTQFSAFDLVLLCVSAQTLPITPRSAQRFVCQPLEGDIYLLALVTDTARGTKGSGQSVTIKADRSSWLKCVELLSQRCPSNSQDAPPTVKISTPYGSKTGYRMTYLVVDSLVSFWREFMSLHDLRTNKPPLLPQILAQAQAIAMPATPEHRPPEFFRRDSLSDSSTGGSPTPSPRFSFMSSGTEEESPDFASASAPLLLPPAEGQWAWTSPPPGITPAVLAKFRATFNDSQLLSLKTAAEQESGLTLIQGPPGTGKTTTAIGILNAVHLAAYHRYYELLLSAVLGSEGVACRNFRTSGGSEGPYSNSGGGSVGPLPPGHDPMPWVQLVSRVAKAKPRMLVAAPSNVAVDNILQRIMQRGFLDGNGNKYNPSILRVGGGKSDAVQDVSLERMVDAADLALGDGQGQGQGQGHTTDLDRRRALQRIAAEMRACVQDVYRLQSLLLNLRLAFCQHPIPTGWELRVDGNTALPYWVDHLNCRVSTTPPALPPPEPDAPPAPLPGAASEANFLFQPIGSQHPPADINDATTAVRTATPTPATTLFTSHAQLPEFQHYSTLICQALEHLDRLKLQHSRCHARVDPVMFGGVFEARQAIESSCIDAAHVVFSTLNSTASAVLEMSEFLFTLIDEAAQCSEPSLLIALRKKCRHCVMVGDPKQLPATIFSDSAKHKGYGRSMFERLMMTGQPSVLLNVQYRMSPRISHFSNTMFYDSRVHDGANVCSPGHLPPYICPLQEAPTRAPGRICLDPFLFFDLSTSSDSGHARNGVAGGGGGGGDEEFSEAHSGGGGGGGSKSNPQEARLCLAILKTLLLASLSSGGAGSIGIITPYNEQLTELRRLFEAHGFVHGAYLGVALGDAQSSMGQATARGLGAHSSRFKQALQSATLDIEISTVDGFQGKEKNHIIISCVRANDFGSIGFLSDTRRMNVALTRAKHGMFVVGNGETLSHNPHWGALLEYAEHCEGLVPVQNAEVDLLQLLQERREQSERQTAATAATAEVGAGMKEQLQPANKRMKLKEEGEEG